jgi:hypothetical protein
MSRRSRRARRERILPGTMTETCHQPPTNRPSTPAINPTMKTPFRLSSAFFGLLAAAPLAPAATTSHNSGSLGAVADGVNTDNVLLNQPGALAAPGDLSNGYTAGERTTIPFLAALNPSATSPFTIEFWANPSGSDNDDAVVSNRFATGNRSGWTFFQRNATTGWNFRMYNGSGGNVGWDLTGGTANAGSWSHIVAIWDGTGAQLYVNGSLADSTNDSTTAPFTYNPNTAVNSPTLNIGANFDGGSPYNGQVDEVAWYPSALSPAQIANHFTLAGSALPDAYRNAVLADGAALYLQNIPEPGTVAILGLCGLVVLRRRR